MCSDQHLNTYYSIVENFIWMRERWELEAETLLFVYVQNISNIASVKHCQAITILALNTVG